jgi:hypothetical protein
MGLAGLGQSQLGSRATGLAVPIECLPLSELGTLPGQNGAPSDKRRSIRSGVFELAGASGTPAEAAWLFPAQLALQTGEVTDPMLRVRLQRLRSRLPRLHQIHVYANVSRRRESFEPSTSASTFNSRATSPSDFVVPAKLIAVVREMTLTAGTLPKSLIECRLTRRPSNPAPDAVRLRKGKTATDSISGETGFPHAPSQQKDSGGQHGDCARPASRRGHGEAGAGVWLFPWEETRRYTLPSGRDDHLIVFAFRE